MIDRERWDKVKRLLQAALDRPAEERAGYLNEACGIDHDVRAEVESLLVAHAEAGSFAERPAMERLHTVADATAIEQGALPAGRQIGEYEILAWIDAGGMGDVYRARDPKLGRDI